MKKIAAVLLLLSSLLGLFACSNGESGEEKPGSDDGPATKNSIVGKWGFLYEDVLYRDGDHKIGQYNGEDDRWTLLFNDDNTGTEIDKDEQYPLTYEIIDGEILQYTIYSASISGGKETVKFRIENLTSQKIDLSEISDTLPKHLSLIFERIE